MDRNYSNPIPLFVTSKTLSLLNLYLPWVTKTEFLLTVSNYNIKQTSEEKTEKYQLGHYILIQHQILQTNMTRTVWQTARRSSCEIMGVRGIKRNKNYIYFILYYCACFHRPLVVKNTTTAGCVIMIRRVMNWTGKL